MKNSSADWQRQSTPQGTCHCLVCRDPICPIQNYYHCKIKNAQRDSSDDRATPHKCHHRQLTNGRPTLLQLICSAAQRERLRRTLGSIMIFAVKPTTVSRG